MLCSTQSEKQCKNSINIMECRIDYSQTVILSRDTATDRARSLIIYEALRMR
uniref:Uncharacterized protein n=1 Tax=Anguilla anguilla TaxID=7936 RepID=A0A0E9Q184_ANGAN